MKRIAVFPGSFDPFTYGHLSVVERGLNLFDEIIVAIGKNSTKQTLFPMEKRLKQIAAILEPYPRVSITEYTGLTADFCRKNNAEFILRGLRTEADFSYEAPIGQMNRLISKGVETVFLLSLPEHSAISSTIVRDIIRNGGDISDYVPPQMSQLP